MNPTYAMGVDEQNALGAEDARRVYAETRILNLPRAPLYVPGEKPPKGKATPLGPIARRVADLRKRYPALTPFTAARRELDGLLGRAA